MSKLFAFVPSAQWGVDFATETLIRFGYSKHGVQRFTSLLEPSPLLMCIDVPNGREASYKLKQILRGNEPYTREGRRFESWADFRTTPAGDNYFATNFSKGYLKLIFKQIEKIFKPGEPDVEQPGADSGVQMRLMSSEQAARILCGMPGSIEDVLDSENKN